MPAENRALFKLKPYMQLWSILYILKQKMPICHPHIIDGLQSHDRWTVAVSHSDLKE